MSYTKQFVRSSAILFVFGLLTAFIGYLIRIVMTRKLTVEDYGLFWSVFSFITFFAFIRDFGFGNALTKFIAEFKARNELSKIKALLKFVFLTKFSIILIISSIFILLADKLASNYFRNELAYLIIIVLTIKFSIEFLDDLLSSCFSGLQKFHPLSIKNLLLNLIILIALFFSTGLLAISISYLIASLVVLIIFIPVFFKTFNVFKIKSIKYPGLYKETIKFAIPSILLGFSSMILGQIDTIMLTAFRTLEEVGIYNVVLPSSIILAYLGGVFAGVFMPLSSELWAKNEKEKLANGLNKLLKYSLILILPISLLMFSFPDIWLRIFFGIKYETGADALRILSIGSIFVSLGYIILHTFSGIGKPIIATYILVSAAIFNAITNYFFIPIYGMNGAAITTLASQLIILFASVYLIKKNLSFQVPLKDWFKTIVAGGIFLLLIFILKNLLSLNIWIEILISVSLSLFIYILLLFLSKVLIKEDVLNIVREVFSK